MPGTKAVGTTIYDPLGYMAPLPYFVRCYPYGFPADLASDSPDVLEAARESWGAYGPRFDRPPIRVHVTVSPAGGELPPAPVLRGQRHLLMWVADRENFSVIDRVQRFGYACVTRATVEDRVFFRWHFLDALIYMLLELNYLTALHGACVAREGAGVLLCGKSGVGKSTLSYACARRGWTYISDDSSSILWDGSRTVLGESHHFRFRANALELFPELRGRTLGHPLGGKPTIEVWTADLAIRTARECRLERIVFLERNAEGGPCLARVSAGEVRRRISEDLAPFDPDVEVQRRGLIETICELPGFELRYAHFEEALDLLEKVLPE